MYQKNSRGPGTLTTVLIAISLAILTVTSHFGLVTAQQADDQQLLTREQAIEATNGPVYLDAYWVDRNNSSGDSTTSARKEVGPGDGASTLAVVLANRGTSDITAVTATLSLPDGFSSYGAAGASTSTAQASYNQLIAAGETFTLYFDVIVSDKAKVGTFTSNLSVDFNRIRETGTTRNATLTVPFRLTGKVILDPVVITRNLVPGVSNDVQIAIRNTGSAPATGVIVSITGININGGANSGSSSDSSGSSTLRPQITSFGTNTFSLGTINPNSNSTLTTSLFPNIATGGNAAGVQLEVIYNDANGNARTLSPSVGVIVLQNAPSIIGVKALSGDNDPSGSSTTNTSTNRIVSGKTDNFVLEIANKGTTPITNAVVTMQSSSASLNILGDSKWAVDRIDAHSQARLQTQVFAATSLIGNPATFDVTIDYLLNGSPKTEKYVLGTFVDGEISLRIYDLSINFVGGTPTLVGNILNEGNTAALFTNIELVMDAQQAGTSGTGAGSNVSDPNNDNENGGVPPQPEANQAGQLPGANRNFTRQFAQPSSPQYLGDVTANSPLPFSMPIPLAARPGEQQQAGAGGGGTIPVTLKITYKDSLRNSHELVVSGAATFAQQTISSTGFNGQVRSQRQDTVGLPTIAWIAIAGIAVAAGVISYYFVRKKRRTKVGASKIQTTDNDQEKRENIEDILEKTI